VDIESITGNEERVGNYLYDYLSALAAQFGGNVERMDVEPHRFNAPEEIVGRILREVQTIEPSGA
jgi:hypothetical protein